MDFAITECADRTFGEVCARLSADPAAALQAAANTHPVRLRVEVGSLTALGAEMAVLHATWRDRGGGLWLDTELRVIGVNRGAEPLTELVMIGGQVAGTQRADVLAWAHAVLATLVGEGHVPAHGPRRPEHRR